MSVPDRRPPLTVVGWSTLTLGIVSYLVGWRLGWIELMVVAAACATALALALPFVLGRIALDVQRSVEPERVMVGEPAIATLVVSNPARRRTRPVTIEDHRSTTGSDAVVAIDVPGLGPAGVHTAISPLPTARRAAVTVGPGRIARADPLGMFRRHAAQAPAATLWVHPRWAAVPALPSGFAKDLEGPTSDTSPAGDIAFHALRPYQSGDDRRHIHWMSTARSGTLMVRHYVDNRRPALGVLLDTAAEVHDADQFETAVEVVTSLLMSSVAHRLPVVARTTDEWLLGRYRPGSPDSVLERMTTVQPTPVPPERARRTSSAPPDVLLAAAADLLRIEPATSALAVVTGSRSANELIRTVAHVRTRARPIVVAVDRDDDGERWVHLPGARVLRVRDLDEFRAAWGGLAS